MYPSFTLGIFVLRSVSISVQAEGLIGSGIIDHRRLSVRLVLNYIRLLRQSTARRRRVKGC